jgi:hypothetical protein
MLAGLLKQPRMRRGAGAASLLPPEEDPVELRKRVVQLEQELKLAEELIAVLRELPGNRERDTARSRTGTSKPKRKARRRAATSGKKKSPARGAGTSSADGGEVAG